MKQTHHIGYVQTPSVKNLSNVKNALVENGLVPLTTPNEMLPDAIVEGLKKLEIHDFGMIHEGKYRIRYFDIDGKILKIEYVAEGGRLTPPSNPSYDNDYLIFDEWNYDIENYVVEQPTDVGAIYKTVDDATYMFCRFTNATGLNPKLAISGFTSIDWGDGFIGSNNTHTYANEGEYVIKIYGNSIFASSSSDYLLGSESKNKALKKCYIRNGVTSIEQYAFYACDGLTNVSIPNSVTSIEQYAFGSCYGLTNVSIPNSVTSIEQYAFYACYGLTNVSIPNSVTSIEQYAFNYCYGLKNISISKNVTSIGSMAFNSCYSLTNYFIYCDTVPSVYSNTFNNINTSTIFWVIDSIIENLKVATDWEKYANRMKPLSWYPSLTDPNAE